MDVHPRVDRRDRRERLRDDLFLIVRRDEHGEPRRARVAPIEAIGRAAQARQRQ